ncbi:MAG: excinuclease ABC subunit UvrC [Deltaproteobacteria bacterium]|nr:excinuclease ABC subunit UvrC [Deltaproteobacteria bacterium]
MELLPHLIPLKKKIDAFPKHPGVYLMRDATGEVIYVGKAKSLRDRVRSYLTGHDDRIQIEYLLQRMRDVENIVTESEHQAFILERDLITKYKPRYNVRLKDDKAYLSIRIDENAEWPRLELVRKVENDGAQYFGPFSFSYELRTLLDIVKRVVPLRSCTNTVFYNRQRPCLEYQIKRCAGPCTLPVDRAQYAGWIKQAKAILTGKTDALVKDLEAHMQRASEELRFEDAALYRDRLSVLQNLRSGQRIISSSGEDRDCFALYREESLVALSVLKSRAGRVSDNQNFVFTDVGVSDEEVLEGAVSQYYDGKREIPDEVLLPIELQNLSLIKQAVEERAGRAVEFVVPERGVKRRLLNLAALNAKQHFLARFDAEARFTENSKALAKLLGLRQMPRRIECVDISNFQGSDIVGALVSFFDGTPDKERYRKYKISRQDKPDDFASIEEVVRRRLQRGLEENTLPDLLIIDGGPGQLRRALLAREETGANIDIVALAKERTKSDVTSKQVERSQERIYTDPDAEPVAFEPDSEVTHLIQRIRDEAHRFVITFHRTTRSKRVFKSALDTIAGVGPERRSRLLRTYGSVEAMRRADPHELAKAGRMPLPLAEKILRVLNSADPKEAR